MEESRTSNWSLRQFCKRSAKRSRIKQIVSQRMIFSGYILLFFIKAEILFIDNELVAFKSGSDCRFYVTGPMDEVWELCEFVVYCIINIIILICPERFNSCWRIGYYIWYCFTVIERNCWEAGNAWQSGISVVDYWRSSKLNMMGSSLELISWR